MKSSWADGAADLLKDSFFGWIPNRIKNGLMLDVGRELLLQQSVILPTHLLLSRVILQKPLSIMRKIESQTHE